jgi:hypothetical protein
VIDHGKSGRPAAGASARVCVAPVARNRACWRRGLVVGRCRVVGGRPAGASARVCVAPVARNRACWRRGLVVGRCRVVGRPAAGASARVCVATVARNRACWRRAPVGGRCQSLEGPSPRAGPRARTPSATGDLHLTETGAHSRDSPRCGKAPESSRRSKRARWIERPQARALSVASAWSPCLENRISERMTSRIVPSVSITNVTRLVGMNPKCRRTP